ncbi:MAG TPA: CocE/NonD family hydrolase [Solirubrobacteraceae bacterium]|nr:CocE/NonD family hydrolase [Solirubrobacteraceae bacterium]
MSPRQSPALLPEDRIESVLVVDNTWIELADGVRLAVRLWLPPDSETAPVPAVLTSVPYRKSDGTAIGDAAWGTYFAAHGFAYARVDIRGSGDSDGVLQDEYSPQEQDDAEQVIDWLARQSWCTGAVGMIGISWGGFAALQMAARHPEALRGVVAIHASDDRYADDVHYVGGCVSAMDMAQWATSMLAYLSQPPDPAVVGEGWREQWRQRLDATPMFIETWLGHQRRDDYWRQGSACEDYQAIRCPVFAVGGWSDGYRDMVLRIVEHVSGPVRGLIGPWGHTSPENGAPGPAIGFLQECIRFFDASLNGAENRFFDQPRLLSYMQEPVAPAGSYGCRPGRWVADPAWPSPSGSPWDLLVGGAGLHERSGEVGSPVTRGLRGRQSTGVEGGVWCGDGSPADFGLDQRPDDGSSLCWDSAPLPERVELLGCGEARLRVSVDHPQALVAVRVCDVAPDGASTLVARGLLNLSRREGHDRSIPMPVDAPVEIRVPLQSTAYALPAGHRVRLAVSNTYWPWAWPSPGAGVLTVHCGEGNALTLPRRLAGEPDAEVPAFDAPESGQPLASQTTMLRDGGRQVRRSLADGFTEVEFDWHPSRVRILATGTEMGEENVTHYRIRDGDPMSASVTCRVAVSLERAGWRTRSEARSTMTSDRETFTVTTTLDAYEDDVRVHARTVTHQFARDGA